MALPRTPLPVARWHGHPFRGANTSMLHVLQPEFANQVPPGATRVCVNCEHAVAQVSWDTSFAPPAPRLRSRRQEHPKPNKSPKRHLPLEQASTLLDTSSCPTGHWDRVMLRHSFTFESRATSSTQHTSDNFRSRTGAGPHREMCRPILWNPQCPAGGKTHHVTNFPGTLSRKEAAPLKK